MSDSEVMKNSNDCHCHKKRQQDMLLMHTLQYTQHRLSMKAVLGRANILTLASNENIPDGGCFREATQSVILACARWVPAELRRGAVRYKAP
jgi:hypothetical protein